MRLGSVVTISAIILFSAAAIPSVHANDLKDELGPLLDPSVGYVDQMTQYGIYERNYDYLYEFSNRTVRYDYHYVYDTWNLYNYLTYGLKDNLQVGIGYQLLIPYSYGYNALEADSAGGSTAARGLTYEGIESNVISFNIEKRSADNGASFSIIGKTYQSFYKSDIVRPTYTAGSKTSSNQYSIDIYLRMITNPSPKMLTIEPNLDGRYFPLLEKNQTEVLFRFSYVNYFDAYEYTEDRIYQGQPLSSANYHLKETLKANQGAGLYSLYNMIKQGVTDEIEASVYTYYQFPFAGNYQFNYSFPNDPSACATDIADALYNFNGYINPTLRVRTTKNTEAYVSAYVSAVNSTVKEDLTAYRTITQTRRTSYRYDDVELDTSFDFTFRYMSDNKSGKSEPYTGSNLDSKLRPLLAKNQVLVSETFSLQPYFFSEWQHYSDTANPDYEYNYRTYRIIYDVSAEAGYGITDYLELSGSAGLRFPYDYLEGTANISGDLDTSSFHYNTKFYGGAALKYRPKQDRQAYVRFQYKPDFDYSYSDVLNFTESTREKYKYNSYEIFFGVNVLF